MSPIPIPRSWAPAATFAALAAAAAAARYASLGSVAAPSGVDGGNWLAIGHAILGQGPEASAPYPPAVPLLAVGATAAFGVVRGLHLLAAAASVAPAVGSFAVLSRHARWPAVAICVPLLVSVFVSDPAAWGGYPQLIGFGLLVPWVAWADRASFGVRRHVLIGALLTASVLATSHLAAAVGSVGVGTVALAGVLQAQDRRAAATRLVRTGLAVALGAIPFVPLYLRLLPDVASATVQPHGNTISSVRMLIDVVRFGGREAPEAWTTLVLLAAIAPAALVGLRRTGLWRLSVGLLCGAAVPLALSREVRFAYALPLAATAALALVTHELIRPPRARTIVAATLAAWAGVHAILGASSLPEVRRRYTVLDPASYDGLTTVPGIVPEGTLIAVSTVRGVPLGWWVEGVARRPALSASDPQWLFFPAERREADVAAAVFASPFPTVASLERAAAAGAAYVAYDPRSTGSPVLLADLRASHPWALAAAGEGLVVLSTRRR